MSFNFFKEIEVLHEKKIVGPETFNEFASRQVEKFIKEPQNQHLANFAYFQLCINLDEERIFLVVKPEFLENTKAKENYINAYKTYLNLKGDNCIVNIEDKYCCFKYNFFKLSQFNVPLNVYLQNKKVNQVFLLRFALLLLKSIRKCHEKVYFVEHIKQSTVHIDIRNLNVLLINPIQKILLDHEMLFNMRNSQENQNKKIQIQIPKRTVLELINKDQNDFIKTFLRLIGINDLHIQDMLECNLLSSFFQRRFSGKITDSMQYLIIYFYLLKQDKQTADLLYIEFMLVNVLYQDVKARQQKQLKQILLNMSQKQNNPNNNINNNNKSKQNIVNSKSTQKIDKQRLNESNSLQNLSSSNLLNSFSPQNKETHLSINQQNLHSISKKYQTQQENSYFIQQPQSYQNQQLAKSKQSKQNIQTSLKQINSQAKNKQIPNSHSKSKLSSEQKSTDSIRITNQQENQKDQQQNQSTHKLNNQIFFDSEQILNNTFYQSEFSNCLKDQTKWLNSIYKIEMTQNQAYVQWKKLEKIKEKSSQQWIMIAWILFKYFKFFKEPLQIIYDEVLKVKNKNFSFKQKAQNQKEETSLAETNSQSYCLIGIIYWKWKKYHKAIQAFNQALKIDSRNQYALYYLAKNCFIFESNFVKGNNYLLQLLQINPYNQDLIKKTCKFIQNCQQNVYYWYFLAMISQPKCHKVILKLAQHYYENGEYKLALFFCAKGIDLNKNEKDFYFLSALIFINQGNSKQALKFLIKSQNCSNKEVSGYLVEQFIQQGDQEETEINFYKDLNSIQFLKPAEIDYTNYLYD